MRRLRVVTVCGCGLGSSLMAKMTLDNILERRGVTATIEAADAGTVSGYKADIVVATREFEYAVQNLDCNVVVVTSFVNEEELEQKVGPVVDRLVNESG